MCGTTTRIAMTAIPMIPSRPVGPVREVSRKACPTATSRQTQDQEVERQHRREHLRRGDPGGEPGGGLRLDEDDAEHDEDERRDEEEGAPAGDARCTADRARG